MKKIFTALLFAGAIFIGCAEKPYKSIKISEAQNHQDEKVIVEGLPSLIRKDIFILTDGEHQLYVQRGRWGKAFFATGDYQGARRALDAIDSDEEKVKVYGILTQDNTIEGRFVEVEGTMHEFYY